jgi:Spy/CpxP family protein refolding chaperone
VTVRALVLVVLAVAIAAAEPSPAPTSAPVSKSAALRAELAFMRVRATQERADRLRGELAALERELRDLDAAYRAEIARTIRRAGFDPAAAVLDPKSRRVYVDRPADYSRQ